MTAQTSAPTSRLLIIDDEKDNLQALARLLRKDFIVECTESAEEALKIVAESPHSFEAFLSDQRMPGMSGSEFFEEVQKLDNKVSRVLLTGFADLDAIIDAVNRGHIWRYLAKPWEPIDLKLTLKQACERTRLYRELEVTQKESAARLIELKAKEWSRSRLMKILLHEFRTAPQILEGVLELENAGDSAKKERLTFIKRLQERFGLLEEEIQSFHAAEEKISLKGQSEKSLKELLLTWAHDLKQPIDGLQSLSDTFSVRADPESLSLALASIHDCLSKNAPENYALSLQLTEATAAGGRGQNEQSVYLNFLLNKPQGTTTTQAPLPKSLEGQEGIEASQAQLAWQLLFEPFVGAEKFQHHSQGLRTETAAMMKVLAAMGVRYDISASLASIEMSLEFKSPKPLKLDL